MYVILYPAANAEGDVTGAVALNVDESGLPADQVLAASGIDPGDYRSMIAEAKETITITAGAVASWTQASGGPGFKSPANLNNAELLGTNPDKVGFRWRAFLPTDVVGVANHRAFRAGTTTGPNLGLNASSGNYIYNGFNVEIDGTERSVTWSGGVAPWLTETRGVMATRSLAWDGAGLLVTARNGGTNMDDGTLVNTAVIGGAAGKIKSNVPYGLLCAPGATPSNFMPAGMRFEFAELWADIGSGWDLVFRVEGNAATVNGATYTDWRVGANAV